jgi:mRNA-degrading endonuclease toxin of MazEF toxin-antitoxin module
MASVDDIWLVDFGEPFPAEPSEHRPAVVVGPPSSFGLEFPTVFLVPLTTTRRGLSLHVGVEATAATGLDQSSYAQCEQLRSVGRRRLIHRLGQIDPATSRSIDDVVRILLDH